MPENINNIFDFNNKNFLFLASAIAVMCENSPITLDLEDVERFWSGEIRRLKYDMCYGNGQGSITFSLEEKDKKSDGQN